LPRPGFPAWSGDNPERLACFYAEDAFYLDPGSPAGIKGKSELLVYFRNLLAHNPNWVWSQIEAIPIEGGFFNKWRTRIPVGAAQQRETDGPSHGAYYMPPGQYPAALLAGFGIWRGSQYSRTRPLAPGIEIDKPYGLSVRS
jgi:hypothetical protein